MSEFDQFHFFGNPDDIVVREVGSGEVVDRPDIAAIALGSFSEAITGAGGHLHLVPGELSTDNLITPDDPEITEL